MKTIVFSVDVEWDLEPFSRGTAFGVTEGLPPLFDLLQEENVPADMLFLGSLVASHGWAAKKAARLGFGIGSHGWDHDYLCIKTNRHQHADINRATKAIQQAAGVRPETFRAANFSISAPALRYLASQGYVVDSSVMPERVARRWGLLPVYDYRGAPLTPYRPSGRHAAQAGDLPIVEVPLAVNTDRPGTPLGTGLLNSNGMENTLRRILEYPTKVVALLAHPWELVDLKEYVHALPEDYARICSPDLGPLRNLFRSLRGRVRFTTLRQVGLE
ncbi:MAG: hypothetical protein DME87_02625 [Verrucomicrobia bacterium]|nr:MAG: hypothetical protein DME87_02625 [Verrucomicrobiota bacterium]